MCVCVSVLKSLNDKINFKRFHTNIHPEICKALFALRLTVSLCKHYYLQASPEVDMKFHKIVVYMYMVHMCIYLYNIAFGKNKVNYNSVIVYKIWHEEKSAR